VEKPQGNRGARYRGYDVPCHGEKLSD
jgi:hypothetical protein